jgi:cysteine-rich repeat protein
MRTRRLAAHAALAVAIGLACAAPFAGCGGDDATVDSSTTSTGAGASGGGGEGGGSGLNCVVDGVKTDTEECDDGNDVIGDGCENDCSFTCTQGTVNGDAKCDDSDPCNGVETCAADHTCTSSEPAADGTSCGEGKVCKSGVCGDVTCGDLFVSAPEECEDGNLDPTDGCDDCRFTCLTGDPARDCSDGDPCNGTNVCDDSAHICQGGESLPEDAPCGDNAYCWGGTCKPAVCGNDHVEPNEECDDGGPIDGDGCDTDCTFTCVDPAIDCPAPPQCLIAICTPAHTCGLTGDAAQNGDGCGQSLFCNSGACIGAGAVCGNGALELGEDCDFGAQNGPGTGCESYCKFSCTMAPDSCPDLDPCDGVETCGTVTVNGHVGQACSPGSNQADCSGCTGGTCVAGVCELASCGNGCVEAAAGEECEPPGIPGCSAQCIEVPVPVCGDGVREAPEQCDDSNTTNLDGCDALCNFEQSQRANYLKMQFATDATCAANQLGAAIVGAIAQGQVQQSIDDNVADGSIAVDFKLLGLDDLSGTSDASVQLGIISGSPETQGGALPYDGTAGLDWWHNVDLMTIDANRDPLALLPASITAKVISAGPGDLDLAIDLAGSPAVLRMTSVLLTGTIGATSKPLTSNGGPPGHLASEHIDPALKSFSTIGQTTLNGAAKLCGNVSAQSLAQVPIPESLVGGGLLACSENYAATNTMLDVFVSGCTVLFIQQIASKQPDKTDPAAPAAGAGGPYTLVANGQKSVSSCKDKNGATVDLATCLDAAAYSSFFKLATNRIIAK